MCTISTTWYGTYSKKLPLSIRGVAVFSLGVFLFGDDDTTLAYLRWFPKELDFPFIKCNLYFASIYII